MVGGKATWVKSAIRRWRSHQQCHSSIQKQHHQFYRSTEGRPKQHCCVQDWAQISTSSTRWKAMPMRIASSAYYTDSGEYKLFVWRQPARIVKRTVGLGEAGFDYVEVINGLKPGDKVVVSDMNDYKKKKRTEGEMKIKYDYDYIKRYQQNLPYGRDWNGSAGGNVNLRSGKRWNSLSIMGPSGCSLTLLNIMGLLDLPTSGAVEWEEYNSYYKDEGQAHSSIHNQKTGLRISQSFPSSTRWCD